MLKWIVATSSFRKLADFKKAAEAWAPILCPDKPAVLSEIVPSDDMTNKETLRKARVRLDLVAMLVFRHAYMQMSDPWFYVWCDASPQWKGLEFFASSFDTLEGGRITRRQLPNMSLARGKQSALHKTIALLWQGFLMVGPKQLQSWCRSIR